MSVNANTGISHLYSKPFNFAASREKAMRRLANERVEEPIVTTRKLATLQIDTVLVHPLDFLMTLQEATYPMMKALYAYVCDDLGEKESQEIEFVYVCAWLSNNSQSEEIKAGMSLYSDWLDPDDQDVDACYEALSKIFDMFVVVEENGGKPATHFKLEEIHALINSIVIANEDSDKKKLVEIVEKVGRDLIYFERYCQAPPTTQAGMLQKIFHNSIALISYHPNLQGDTRCIKDSWKQIDLFFLFGKEKIGMIDFYAYDKGVQAFLGLIEAITELDIPNVSNLVSNDFLKETREQYMTMTLKPKKKSLTLQFNAFISE